MAALPDHQRGAQARPQGQAKNPGVGFVQEPPPLWALCGEAVQMRRVADQAEPMRGIAFPVVLLEHRYRCQDVAVIIDQGDSVSHGDLFDSRHRPMRVGRIA